RTSCSLPCLLRLLAALSDSRSFLARQPPPPFLPSFPTRRSSDLNYIFRPAIANISGHTGQCIQPARINSLIVSAAVGRQNGQPSDRKSTRLNSSHVSISYAVFCLKKKKTTSHGSLTGAAAQQASR